MTSNIIKPLYLIINNRTGYMEENNVNKYLTLIPTDESQDKLKKYEEVWSEIKDLVRSTNYNSDDYRERYMRIKFSSDDYLT